MKTLLEKLWFKIKRFCRFKGVKIVSVIILCLVVISIGNNMIANTKYKSSKSIDGFSLTKENIGSSFSLGLFSNQNSSNGNSDSGGLDYLSSSDYESSVSDIYVEEVKSESQSSIEGKQEEKLVYSAGIILETKDLSSGLDIVHQKVKEVAGIIQIENLYGLNPNAFEGYNTDFYSSPNAYMSIRIPQDKYDAFITSLKASNENLSVKNIKSSIENMTETYYDFDSRLKSLRVQEARLFKFMETAETVSDMLAVEQNLSEVQYEIDKITNSLNTIDNDVAYAKVELEIKEVRKYSEMSENSPSFYVRLRSYIKGSVYNFVETTESILELVIYLAPFAVIITIIVLIIKKVRKSLKGRKKD